MYKKISVHDYKCIYPRRIYVTINASVEQLQNQFRKRDGGILNLENSEDCPAYTAEVVCKKDNNCGVLIWLKSKKIANSIIAHEALHATMSIFKDIGVLFDADNQEPATYMLGYVVDCIEDYIHTKQK